MLSKKKKIITGVVVLAAILILGFWYFFQKDRITVPDTYKYDDLTEYVTLGSYKGIRYTKKVKKVSDSDVQSEVKKAIKKASTTKDVKSGTVGSDSKVKIDFTGKINGKKFDGGSAEDYTLDIANDSMIDGFSEGIVGHKVGDKFDLKLKFPKDYSNKDEHTGIQRCFCREKYEIQEYGGIRKVDSHETGEGERSDRGEGCVFGSFCEDSEGQRSEEVSGEGTGCVKGIHEGDL